MMTLSWQQASKLPVYDYTGKVRPGIFSSAINPKVYPRRRYISTDKTIGSRSIPGMIYKDHLSAYFLPLKGVQHKGKNGYEGLYALWGKQSQQANAFLKGHGAENAVEVRAMCKLEAIANDSYGRRMRPLEVLSVFEQISHRGGSSQKTRELLDRLTWSAADIKTLHAYSPSTRTAQNTPASAWLMKQGISPRGQADLQQASTATIVQAHRRRRFPNPMSAFRNFGAKKEVQVPVRQ